jgi:hypothetical protein
MPTRCSRWTVGLAMTRSGADDVSSDSVTRGWDERVCVPRLCASREGLGRRNLHSCRPARRGRHGPNVHLMMVSVSSSARS